MSLLFAMEYMQWVENWTFRHVVLRFRQSNCLDCMAFRRQELCTISRDCGKRLHRLLESFRSQEAERIFLCETVNLCWQWIQSKHYVRVPKRGSYFLLNNSVRSRNHTMSMTLNLGAVGIIWPASKPVHIRYLKPLHSRVCSQSSLIYICCYVTRQLMAKEKPGTSLLNRRSFGWCFVTVSLQCSLPLVLPGTWSAPENVKHYFMLLNQAILWQASPSSRGFYSSCLVTLPML